jgi:hypothetical protein
MNILKDAWKNATIYARTSTSVVGSVGEIAFVVLASVLINVNIIDVQKSATRYSI